MSDLSDLIYNAIRFSAWAAGQGISSSEDESLNAEDFMMKYVSAADEDDWDGLADRLKHRIEWFESPAVLINLMYNGGWIVSINGANDANRDKLHEMGHSLLQSGIVPK